MHLFGFLFLEDIEATNIKKNALDFLGIKNFLFCDNDFIFYLQVSLPRPCIKTEWRTIGNKFAIETKIFRGFFNSVFFFFFFFLGGGCIPLNDCYFWKKKNISM